AAPVASWHRGAFQDIDQLAIFKPCTKWSDRVHHVRRIPELIHLAVTQAMTGKPGPVYLDMPGDVLYQEVDESKIEYPAPYDHAKRPRPMPSAGEVRGIVDLMVKAEQPVLITGTGVLWPEADAERQAFEGAAGLPSYTTPQARGPPPEAPALPYPPGGGAVFGAAVLIVGGAPRINSVRGHAAPP